MAARLRLAMLAPTIRRSREDMAERILLRDRRRLRRPRMHMEEVDVSRTRLATAIDAMRRTAKDATATTATAATPTLLRLRLRVEEAMADTKDTRRPRRRRTDTTTADDRE